MAKDKEYNKLIHKNKWLKLRKAKLSSNPICERCKEMMALCHDCHILTHTEMGRSGKAHAKRKAKEQLKGFQEKFLLLQIFAQMLIGAGNF